MNNTTERKEAIQEAIKEHGFCPNHPHLPSASPSSNLCGFCLMGKARLDKKK